MIKLPTIADFAWAHGELGRVTEKPMEATMSHPGHKVVKCSKCGAVVLQCRCFSLDKTVEWVNGCSQCHKNQS